jgi:hypothetical protein
MIQTNEIKKPKNKYYRPNVNDKSKIPHKFTPDAQAERNWKASREGREGENYNFASYDKEKYRANYDKIDWSKK